MSSSNNPPSPWVYDYDNQRYVRWDNQRRHWVDERNREARPPQATPPTVAPPPTQRTGGTQNTTGKSGSRGGVSTISIENSLKSLSITPSREKNFVPAYKTRVSDSKTGVETQWDFTDTRPYRDTTISESTRSLNVKRIRQTNTVPNARSITGFRISPDPANDYRPGRVIEVALVPPTSDSTTTSALSQITPLPTRSDLPQGRGTRYRRFVIIRQRPENRNSFEALAIKTYNGLGVASPGVIKSHHVIIHTSTPPPAPSTDEQPMRRPNGQLEGGMQATPIKVEQFDRTKALDSKARLDYMDTYEFDYGVTNIRLWGRIHTDSEATFYSQYSHVWQMVMGAAAGPGPGGIYSGAPSDTASNAPTVTAAQYRSSYPTPAGASGISRPAPSGATGVISDQDMMAQVRSLQQYARDRGLAIPGTTLTAQQIHGLAQNEQGRREFLRRIREGWNESEIDDDDDGDDDDDDDDDDDSDNDEQSRREQPRREQPRQDQSRRRR